LANRGNSAAVAAGSAAEVELAPDAAPDQLVKFLPVTGFEAEHTQLQHLLQQRWLKPTNSS
jgi:hypothetical protein